MQKLLLFCALLFAQAIFSSSLFSQCDNYGYYLDATGFDCGSNEGEICFITNFDIIGNVSVCSGYVVEITYPTANFTPTDLGDFTVQSSNSVTTLRLLPNVTSSFNDIVHCLEGVLSIPNTVFGLTIVAPDDPSDVVTSTSFSVDNALSVGASGQVTLLSDLIGTSILPPAIAATTGQRLNVEGRLIVDVDYGFGASQGGFINNIAFGENASIETLDGQSIALGFFRAKLYSCPKGLRWQGVVINEGDSELNLFRARVERAYVGVDMRADASLIFTASSLINHRIGISSAGDDFRSIDIITPFFISARPVIYGCGVGINLDGVEDPFLRWMNFRENETAVKVKRTISFVGDQLNLKDNDTGFSGEEQVSSFSLYNSVFEGGFSAIKLSTYSVLRIINNEIEEYASGIHLNDNRINARAIIANNIIRTPQNIFAIQRLGSVRLSGNELIGDSHNVVVFGNFGGGHKWRIRNNPLMFAGLNSPAYGNAIFVGVEEATISDNPEMIADDGPSINILGGERNEVSFNSIYASDDNIRMTGSALNTVQCNITDGGTGLHIFNDCSGADIRGNDFSFSNSQNLVYGSNDNTMAFTNPQLYKGNMFLESTPATPVAHHFGSDLEVLFSNYFVNDVNAQGNQLYPFFASSSDFWFNASDDLEDFDCEEGLNDPETDLEKLAKLSSIQYMIHPHIETTYGINIASAIELKGFRHRLELENRGLSLSAFMDTQTSGNDTHYGRIVSNWSNAYGNYANPDIIPTRALNLLNTQKQANDLFSLSQEDISLSRNLMTTIGEKEATLRAMEPIITLTPNGEILFSEENHQAQLDARADLLVTQADYDNLLVTNEGAIQATLPTLIEANISADSEGVLPYEVKKYVDGIALKYLLQENYQLEEDEFAQIETYANLCAAEGGEGVYLARTIFAQQLEEVRLDYNDHCALALPSEQVLQHLVGNESGQAEIYPNPTFGESLLRLTEHHDFQQMQVIDINGILLLESVLTEEDSEIRLNQQNWPVGIYFVTLSGRKETINLKLVVK